MLQDVRYVIVTPVRDEQKHIATTIAAVASQTILPREWIIVNDGSTDLTGSILAEQAAQIPWIRIVHRANRGFRKSGGGVVEAFYDGYQRSVQNLGFHREARRGPDVLRITLRNVSNTLS